MTGTGTAVLSLALEGPTLGTSTIGMGVAGTLWGVAGVTQGISLFSGLAGDIATGQSKSLMKRAIIGAGTYLMGRTASDPILRNILEGTGGSFFSPYNPNQF
jgi:hypothetical protein